MLGLTENFGEWACYDFDQACSFFGRWVENKLDETTKEGKPKYKLSDLLKTYSKTDTLERSIDAALNMGIAKVKRVK